LGSDTAKRCRRQDWRLLLKTPAKPGRHSIPRELHTLIRRMARDKITWGQKRMDNELLLKLGLRVSPRTVRKYLPSDGVGDPSRRCHSQRGSTFSRNHAKGLVITDITAEVARRTKAMLARIKRLIQRLTHRDPQRALSPIKTYNKLVVFRLDDSSRKPGVASLNRADHMKCVKRSPPEKGLPRNPEPISAAPAVPAARVKVRSVIPVCCGGLSCALKCQVSRLLSAVSFDRMHYQEPPDDTCFR
jgi:hypothetical protein